MLSHSSVCVRPDNRGRRNRVPFFITGGVEETTTTTGGRETRGTEEELRLFKVAEKQPDNLLHNLYVCVCVCPAGIVFICLLTPRSKQSLW